MERARDLAASSSKHKADAGVLKAGRDKAVKAAKEAIARADGTEERLKESEAYRSRLLVENAELLTSKGDQAAQINALKATEASQAERLKELDALKATEASQAERIKELEAQVTSQTANIARLEALGEVRASRITHLESSQAAHIQIAEDLRGVVSSLRDERLKNAAAYEAQVAAASAQAVALFKSSEEYQQEKLTFSLETYEAGLGVTRTRVAARFPALDLSFLDEEWDPTAAGNSSTADPPSKAP